MKTDCAVARDLLALYAEDMLSEESRALVEAHLAECAECRAELERLRQPEPERRENEKEMRAFHAFLAHDRKVTTLTAALITALVLALLVVLVYIPYPHYRDYRGSFFREDAKEGLAGQVEIQARVIQWKSILLPDRVSGQLTVSPYREDRVEAAEFPLTVCHDIPALPILVLNGMRYNTAMNGYEGYSAGADRGWNAVMIRTEAGAYLGVSGDSPYDEQITGELFRWFGIERVQ